MKLICLLLTITVLHFTAKGQTFAWAKSMGGALGPPYSPNEAGYAIKTDAYGNTITIGTFEGTADFDPGVGVFNLIALNGRIPGFDLFIQKLDANGNFLWAKQLVGDSSSGAAGLTLDLFSNIYIGGFFRGTKDFDPGSSVYNLTSAGNADIFVLKLDPNGNFLWAKSMGGIGSEGAFDIVVDNLGNTYTTGRFEGTADFNPSNSVYNLTSLTTRPDGFDLFVSKLNLNGEFMWAKQIGGPNFSEGTGIAIDGSNNIFVTGRFSGTVDCDPNAPTHNLTSFGGNNILVEKLDPSGNMIWARQMGGGLDSYGWGIAVDPLGNVVVTGSFWGTVDFDPGPGSLYYTGLNNTHDAFICKLNNSGNLLWARQFGNTYESEGGGFITIDGSSNVYCAGGFEGTVDFDPGAGVFNLTCDNVDGFILKLDSGGEFVWATPVGGASIDGVEALSVSGNGSIVCTGSYRSTVDFDPGPNTFNLTSNGSSDIFVLKLNQSGTVTGIVNPDNEFQIKVLPNPAYQTFYLTAKNVTGKLIQIQVINILGQPMYKSQKIMGSANFSQHIDLSKFPPGSYIVEAVIGNKLYTRKIQKIH